LPIFCFAVVGAAASDLAADGGERLQNVGSMIFVPGRLTEIVTPPDRPDSFELSHGYRFLLNLAPDCPPFCGVADTDEFTISQKAFSSYEAVVDSTSGDIGPLLQVDRVIFGTSTVLQGSQPIGVGFSRSLRWMNTTASEVNDQAVRVRSGQCSTDCGPDDVYFIRGYETTYSIPRFNNAGTQVTVLLLQNPTHYTINGDIYFWSTNSVLVATQPFTLTARQLLVLNTSTVFGANGIGGSVTIANDGRYGDLSAKAVALEPATGFSFDSPALPRIR
jgi:hypothetical protein